MKAKHRCPEPKIRLSFKFGENLVRKNSAGISLYAVVEPKVVQWLARDKNGKQISMARKAIVTTSCAGGCQSYGLYDMDTQSSESLGQTDGCSQPGGSTTQDCTQSILELE
jgi:hypothetical protein